MEHFQMQANAEISSQWDGNSAEDGTRNESAFPLQRRLRAPREPHRGVLLRHLERRDA